MAGWRRLLLCWLLLAMLWQPMLLALSQAHGFEPATPSFAVDSPMASNHDPADASTHPHGGEADSGWHSFLHVLHCCAPGAVLLQDRALLIADGLHAAPPTTVSCVTLPGCPAELLRPPNV